MRAIIFFLISSIFLSATAQDLKVGILKFNPPFEVQSGPNSYFGFDVEIVTDVCKRININCRFVSMPFTRLLEELEAGNIDCAIGAIVITEERQQEFLFSTPYLPSAGQVMAKVGEGIERYRDLRGKRIGTLDASAYMVAANQLYKNEITLSTFNSVDDLIQALNLNKVDAVVWDMHAINYWQAANSNHFVLIGKPFETGSGYAIAFPLGRENLVEQVNAALYEMENDGTFLNLYLKYLSQGSGVTP